VARSRAITYLLPGRAPAFTMDSTHASTVTVFVLLRLAKLRAETKEKKREEETKELITSAMEAKEAEREK
jgi:hypothetical protein